MSFLKRKVIIIAAPQSELCRMIRFAELPWVNQSHCKFVQRSDREPNSGLDKLLGNPLAMTSCFVAL